MGMAASQARFLGLTARKSNVEYQGQQVNQQRTALANESANLYSQMMELTVPTPPSTSDYYTTTYSLDGSQEINASGDYTIDNLSKTYSTTNPNEYRVTLAYSEEVRTAKGADAYTVGSVSHEAGKGQSKLANGSHASLYTFVFAKGQDTIGSTLTLHWEDGTSETYSPYTKDTAGNSILSPQTNYIYKADSNIEGYQAWVDSLESEDKNGSYYFFKATNGSYQFLTSGALDGMKNGSIVKGDQISIGTTYVKKVPHTVDVMGTVETGSSGRYSAIKIYENTNDTTLKAPSTIAGREFSISCKQVMDEDKYNDAYNDYEYEKYKYEKSISDINAQTEVIQHEDQQLELRLDQLDTEQNAISTEMDSVTKVIEDNVEKTFKTFA